MSRNVALEISIFIVTQIFDRSKYIGNNGLAGRVSQDPG
jgi:hypothetical protein